MKLNQHIRNFFFENEYDKLADQICLLRRDGIALYSNTQIDVASIGALVSGLWQASEALADVAAGSDNIKNFRLAFDSTHSGVYILPVEIVGGSFFLCAIYQDEMNPGKLKNNLRLIKTNLEIYLSEFREESESREGYLFKDISDAEIDQMFRVSEL